MSAEVFFLLLFFISASFLLLSFVLGEIFHGVDGVLQNLTQGVFEAETTLDGADDGISPFSLRTIMMFLTGFSAVGYISISAGLPGWLATVLGALVGFVAGWLVYKLLKYLVKISATRNWRIDDAWGHEGEVVIRIEPDRLGKILVLVNGENINLAARSSSRVVIPQGTKVAIVDVDRARGVATVESYTDLIP